MCTRWERAALEQEFSIAKQTPCAQASLRNCLFGGNCVLATAAVDWKSEGAVSTAPRSAETAAPALAVISVLHVGV